MYGRNFPDFVEACAAAVPGDYVPYSFRTWSSLVAIGATMQRRVWYDHGDFLCRPNMYVVLIAPPAQGKGIAYQMPIDMVFKKLTEPVGAKKARSDSSRFAEAGALKSWLRSSR